MCDNYHVLSHAREREKLDRLDDIYQARKAEKEREFMGEIKSGSYQEALEMLWYTDSKGADFAYRAIEAIANAARNNDKNSCNFLDDMAQQWAEIEMEKEEMEIEDMYDEIFNP